MYAVSWGEVELVRLLLDAGADVDFECYEDMSDDEDDEILPEILQLLENHVKKGK